MKKKPRVFCAYRFMGAAMVILGFLAGAFAASAEEKSEPENGVLRENQPDPWMDWGGDLRYRIVYDNARKLDKKVVGHDRINSRFRARVWMKIKQSDDLSYNLRLVTEPRYYHRPETLDEQYQRNEVLFDCLNFKWENIFALPLTATIGRQDIRLGSGFLLMDGTPLDGGRTEFFDAARFTYKWQSRNAFTDVIWIDNHADSAELLKPFNDEDFDFVEQDERGLVLYVSDKSDSQKQLDGYFIYKNDRNRTGSSGSEGNIYTFGSLLKGDIDQSWKYQLEFMPQFGHRNGRELNAFATSNRLTYCFNDTHENRIHFGYEYLSGDDDPDRYFDRVWGRSDNLFSKLYQSNIDTIDGRAYDNSNLHRLNLGWVTEPGDKLAIETNYNLMFADENTSAGGSGGLSRSGNFRGQLLRVELNYKASGKLCHRLELEMFLPGDFYNDDRNDPAVFARYGIVYTW